MHEKRSWSDIDLSNSSAYRLPYIAFKVKHVKQPAETIFRPGSLQNMPHATEMVAL